MTPTDATTLLGEILDTVHPLMAEALHLAAIPLWFDAHLLGAMRQRDDNREAGLVTRLARYSFVTPLQERSGALPSYAVRPAERAILQRHWIAADPEAYRAAHGRALGYWQDHPDPNPYAQASNLLYHRLFVDVAAAANEIIRLFRAYRHDRQLAAIDRLLDTAAAARPYLVALGEALDEFDDLMTHLGALQDQLHGRWDASLKDLETLQQDRDLSPRLQPYVARAAGQALANTGQFVEAIAAYRQALRLFDVHAAAATDADNLAAEKGATRLALGDAYTGLAITARGFDARAIAPTGWRRLPALMYFLVSLPLLLYLSRQLGRQVWRPSFWPALRDLDWLIARLFALGARQYRLADAILEAHGAPAEGVAADERLANLYLAIGDVDRARQAYEHLLAQTGAPLGEYRQAAVRVGLAEALWRLGRPAEARSHLEIALPVLALYEDPYLLGLGRSLLAAARPPGEEAVALFQQAMALFQQQGDLVAATQAAEGLARLAADPVLPPAARDEARREAAALPRRQYRTRYRHWITVTFQRAFVILLAVVIILLPVSTFRLETGSAVAPVITFNATPLLQSDNPDFTPALSQGVSALSLAPAPNPQVLIGVGLALLLGYLVLSNAAGLLIILRTPLAQVQAAGRAAIVTLEESGVSIGVGAARRQLPWDAVTEVITADLKLWRELLIDNAVTRLAAPGHPPLSIRGHTAWYQALQSRLLRQAPASARRLDLGFDLLRSRMGVLFLVTLGLFSLLGVVGQLYPDRVVRDVAGTPYSLADLYPYLYLGLFVPLVWLFALRPGRIRRHTEPGGSFVWWLAGIAVALAVARLATLFRPWLTVPDLYPSLVILLLALAAAVSAWRSRRVRDGARAYSRRARAALALLAVLATLVMGGHLWREIAAYHLLIVGNAQRDRAVQLPDSPAREALVARSVETYTRAMVTALTPVAGISGRDALRVRLGFPPLSHITYLAALNSRATMSSQQGFFAAAVADFTRVLAYNQTPQAHVNRAIAYQGLGTQTVDATGSVDIVAEEYDRALQDFDRAIALAPGQARYRLWRAVAYHALNRPAAAAEDYDAALAMGGAGALTSLQQAQAWTGQGWIAYAARESRQAVAYFQQAAALVAAPAPAAARTLDENRAAVDALLGLGYAYYTLREYDAALDAWSRASQFNASLPQPVATVDISLGTLYWRVATLGDDYEAAGTDRCALADLPQATKEAEAAALVDSLAAFDRALAVPGQPDDDLAFTHRTMAQVSFLLRNCPGFSKTDVLMDAYRHYQAAVALDPDNAAYWYRQGRLAYSVWLQPDEPFSWLTQAIADVGRAAELAPTAPLYWHDRAWMAYVAWLESPASAGPAARRWLFQGLANIERALALDDRDVDSSYRPRYWAEVIRNEAVAGTLSQGDRQLAAGQPEQARAYYELVATEVAGHATAAFKAGVAAVALGDEDAALSWYLLGAARAEAAADHEAVALAQADLQRAAASAPSGVDIGRLEAVLAGVQIDPAQLEDAATAFAIALRAVMRGDVDAAAALYEQGLQLAAAAADRDAVLEAAYGLRDYLLAQPGPDLADVYWPLRQDRAAWAATVAGPAPDLYWRYRADFSFQLIGRLFRRQTAAASDALFARVFQVIIGDIERAYALNPDAHQTWRDFYVDANIGWLYLRRGDDFAAAGDDAAALADYTTAASRIRPDSGDARQDLADATFRAGLTALRLNDLEAADSWYARGRALVSRYKLDAALGRAVTELEALLAVNPALAPAGGAILEDLDAVQDATP